MRKLFPGICMLVVLPMFNNLALAEDKVLENGLHLQPQSAQVRPGGSVHLKLVYCYVETGAPGSTKTNAKANPNDKFKDEELAPLVPQPPADQPDDELAPLEHMRLICEGDEGYDVLTPLVTPTQVQWKVDGPGRVSGDIKGATYDAPASKPSPNTATVSVSFLLGGKKIILLSSIEIAEPANTYQGKVSYSQSMDDVSAQLTGSVKWTENGAGTEAFIASGHLNITVSMAGCSPYSGSVKTEGEMDFHVPSESGYAFTLGTESVDLNCNGVSIPYAILFETSGLCSSQPTPVPQLGGRRELRGGIACDNTNLNWDFHRK